MLALPGPQHVLHYDGDFCVDDTPILLHQEGGQGRGTGWAVWDASVTLAKWLEASSLEERRCLAPQDAAILELGSGTGIAGLVAAACLDRPAHLTDLPEVLPSLQRNVDLNPKLAAGVTTLACDWTKPCVLPSVPYQLVVLSDVVWLAPLVQPLLQTLIAVTAPGSKVLLAHQCRSARVDAELFVGLRRVFDVDEAPWRRGEASRGRIDLYICTRR